MSSLPNIRIKRTSGTVFGFWNRFPSGDGSSSARSRMASEKTPPELLEALPFWNTFDLTYDEDSDGVITVLDLVHRVNATPVELLSFSIE